MVSPYGDPIAIVPSKHQAWREEFERERERVTSTLEARDLDTHVRRIEHVGSTAVPDLAAKDIVDLDIVVDDAAVATVSKAIEDEIGGTRYENSEAWQPVFREENGQRFNDHVLGVSGAGWKISVTTVAVLCERSDLRSEYEQLKRETASDTDELETYGTAKSEFVQQLLETARESDEFTFDFEVPAGR